MLLAGHGRGEFDDDGGVNAGATGALCPVKRPARACGVSNPSPRSLSVPSATRFTWPPRVVQPAARSQHRPAIHHAYASFRRVGGALLLMIGLMVAAASSVSAQAPGERRRDIGITAGTRDSLVRAVATLVRRNYADSLAGERMGAEIERRWRDGAYARFDSASAFVAAIGAHLQAVHRDQHLRLEYFVVPRPMRAPAGTAVAEDLEARRRIAARRGNGVERVERLAGNVALIALRSFEPLGIGQDALASAMTLATGADAVIIDLRANGGGYGEMVGELASYFVAGGTPLGESHDRTTGTTSRSSVPMRQGRPLFGDAPLYILTSRQTFSAAEAFAYTMQTRKRATVVGDTTRGGANPVQVFQLSPQFALFLPIAQVRDLVSNTNWEGRGVRPDFPASSSHALAVAHQLALETLLGRNPGPTVADEVRDALTRVKRTAP